MPYTPVTGPRLLARDAGARRALLDAMRDAAPRMGLQSIHANFLDDSDLAAFDGDWLAREDVQFHWTRDPTWTHFDDFLAALDHKRRKNLRADRRKVADAGIELRILEGTAAAGDAMAAMHGFYARTFEEKWNHAAMTPAFFQHLATAMPDAVVLVLGLRDGRPVAGALCLRGADTLYGRYWGAIEDVPGLHFEACYHQGIDWCIQHGIERFEPGAQGEHKLARGFLPTPTHSRHWVVDRRFHEPLAAWCKEERAAVRRYRESLADHSPFRRPTSP